jgi:hypothetical protein
VGRRPRHHPGHAAELAAKPEWTYWLGRALHAGGRTTEGNALFEKIAGQANFYGNLADEELAAPSCRRPRPRSDTEEQRAARDNPAIRRALAFFRNDMRTEAVREWNWALRGMDDRQLLAAADLAKRNQIWDRAINTADKTKNEHDYSLRFLAPYGETVRPAAQNQSLDDAWVYGLMRQESRFITSAKSNVGASGLMQLMPATAKWVAKKIGLRDFSQGASTIHRDQRAARHQLHAPGHGKPRQPPGARLRRLQRRPRPGQEMARRPPAGRRHLRRDHPVQRNARLRQESDEQCGLLALFNGKPTR